MQFGEKSAERSRNGDSGLAPFPRETYTPALRLARPSQANWFARSAASVGAAAGARASSEGASRLPGLSRLRGAPAPRSGAPLSRLRGTPTRSGARTAAGSGGRTSGADEPSRMVEVEIREMPETC